MLLTRISNLNRERACHGEVTACVAVLHAIWESFRVIHADHIERKERERQGPTVQMNEGSEEDGRES